jgi:LuxR family transcriptional regulator, maltose regulon positive regulatory protein
MPRKSTKTTPMIISGVLYTDDRWTGTRIGSAQWFTWLAQATTFYYKGDIGTFTARCEAKQRGGVYWTAYRRSAGKLSKRYLGKPDALTADRLATVAAALARFDRELAITKGRN